MGSIPNIPSPPRVQQICARPGAPALTVAYFVMCAPLQKCAPDHVGLTSNPRSVAPKNFPGAQPPSRHTKDGLCAGSGDRPSWKGVCPSGAPALEILKRTFLWGVALNRHAEGAKKLIILLFFIQGEKKLVAFLDGNGLFWEVVGGKSFLFSDFCRFLPF